VALTASVELSSRRLEHPATWTLHVELHNTSEEALRFSTATMRGPVSFEVVDATGRRVPLGPPPTPPANLAEGIATVQPGQSLSLEFYGDELFTDAPPPGTYSLRFSAQAPAVDEAWAGPVTSPWVEFDVARG